MTAPLEPGTAPEAPPESGGAMTVEELAAAIQAILDQAIAEGREMTDDEVAKAEQMEHQLAAAKKREQNKQQAEQKQQADAARRAALAARQAARLAPVNAGLMGMVAPVRPDDTLDRAFNAYLRTGRENADLQQLRAQGEGAPTEGGYLVPQGFRDKLIDRMKQFGGLANHVETINTSDGRPIEWPTIDDTSNTGEVVQEGGTFSAGADMVFGQASLGAYSYMAGGGSSTPLRLSRELLQDAAFDVEKIVSDKLGERIARIQSTHLVNGTGAGQPQGIVYGLTGTEVSSALSYADLVDAIHRVDPAYRDGAKWAFNDLSLAAIRKLVDGDNRPLLQPAGAGIEGSPGGEMLLGFPVVIDQAFANLTLTSGALINWGVFGQLAEGYVLRRVQDVEILVNPYTRMANRQIEFTAWARMDAVRQNVNAYTVLAGYTA